MRGWRPSRRVVRRVHTKWARSDEAFGRLIRLPNVLCRRQDLSELQWFWPQRSVLNDEQHVATRLSL